ncbi:MAG: hypothetical protein M1819_006294 [Sarea resinae]|nr:MAG: hypothetical protein M1819_006294 [Sarea resinae]
MLQFIYLALLSSLLYEVFAIEPGYLGIELNRNLADKGYWAYTSIVQFHEDVLISWTDPQIVGLVQQGYADARAYFDDPKHSKEYPKMQNVRTMTAIVTGTSVYFSSSIRGPGSFIYEPVISANGRATYIPGNFKQPSPCALVAQALTACKAMTTNGAGHRVGGGCGEVMAALAFCIQNPTGNLQGAKVVTWGMEKDFSQDGAPKVLRVMNPCGQGRGLDNVDVWGRASFTTELGMIAIKTGVQPENRDVAEPTTISACFPYAAGIGAGNTINSKDSRYDGAYPNLINLQLGKDPDDVDFTFIARSGAKTLEITEQANQLDSGQQMITISSGGNDVGLVDDLNDCVFTFKGPLSGDCEETLANTQDIIDSDDFSFGLDGLLNAAKDKLAPGGTIYYTGYAKFWDASSNDCDSISWNIWSPLFTSQYLTQARRQKMNDLVDSVNTKIEEAVQRGGDQVVFVDYDPYVGYLNGRYCLPGTNEDKGNAANRNLLFFYEMKTSDTPLLESGEDPWKEELRRRDTGSGGLPANATIDGEIGSWILQTLQQNPDAQLNNDVVNAANQLERDRRKRVYQIQETQRTQNAEMGTAGH